MTKADGHRLHSNLQPHSIPLLRPVRATAISHAPMSLLQFTGKLGNPQIPFFIQHTGLRSCPPNDEPGAISILSRFIFSSSLISSSSSCSLACSSSRIEVQGRNAKGGRTHFASAMALLGYTDGTIHQSGVSYPELVEFITRYGANVDSDLDELCRRVVFYMCVSNTDYHLHNHGFLLTDKGWILSPAYDINPVETGTGLSLNISEKDNALDLNLAIEVAQYFRVSEKKAFEIIGSVKKSVSGWNSLAEKYRISKKERGVMSRAFRIVG